MSASVAMSISSSYRSRRRFAVQGGWVIVVGETFGILVLALGVEDQANNETGRVST